MYTKAYLLVAVLFFSALFISPAAQAQTLLTETEKPAMLVVTGNYGLLIGYSFVIEHRGAKRTGRKKLYKKLEDHIDSMGNPSDLMNKMYELGYDFVQAYNFTDLGEKAQTNYVFRKRKK